MTGATAATGRAEPARDSAPTEDDWERAVASITVARSVLLVCHVHPDGDALGSMLAVALGLSRAGRTVQASFPGDFALPDTLSALPGRDLLVSARDADPRSDVVVAFDAASADRLGELADRLPRAADVIVCDHHVSNTRFGTVHLVDPGAAATAVVADELLRRLGVPLDEAIAECLYVGLTMDTGSFRYAGTTPAVHEFAARLLRTGIRPEVIGRRLFDSQPFGALQLLSDVLARAALEPAAVDGLGLVWTYATQADLARHGQRYPVLESLIDVLRTAEEAEVACVLKEQSDGGWAVSLRSRGAVDVSRVAVALGGGGHPHAAGFTAYGPPAGIVDTLRRRLGPRQGTD